MISRQVGNIVIVNGTGLSLNGAVHWDIASQNRFPATIAPFSVADVYVDIAISIQQSIGSATYTASDGQLQFGLEFRLVNNSVKITTQTKANGHIYYEELSWKVNGKTGFVVAGQHPHYFINNSVSGESWMSTLLPLFGDRCLRDITLPGSHCAGMSEIRDSTAFSNAFNTQTQKLSILNQLMRGSRYLDIRPLLVEGKYWTGHFSYNEEIGSYQGARGQSIDDVIRDINDFAASHNELVILNLSHDSYTDAVSGSYRSLTKTEYQELLQLIFSRLKHLFEVKDDVTLIPLSELITGRPVVLVFVDTSDDFLGKGTSNDYTTRGFYRLKESIGPHVSNNGAMKTLPFNASIPSEPPEVSVYDHDSETEDLSYMMKDQISKMQNFSFRGSHCLFLLSWTLTLSDVYATLDATRIDFKSIEDIATAANRRIYDQILPMVASGHRPNIVFLDYYSYNAFTALVVAINLKVLKGES